MVRTTLTLEKDVAARLDQVARRRRLSMKAVVNEALRVGLASMDAPPPSRAPFRTAGFDSGPSLVGSLDNIEEVLARVEGDDHR
jgi:hypothetical protein